MTPIWVPFVTAILGTALAYFFAGRRETSNARRAAIAKFRSAFAEAITQIDEKDAHFLMSQAQVQHDVAIYEFRRYIKPEQLGAFDESVEKFRKCRSGLIPAALSVWESLGSGEPIDDSDTVALKQALNELVAYADKT